MQLLNGDCLELLPEIPDKSVDMIFTDLPYGTTRNTWDRVIPLEDYVEIAGKLYKESEYLLYAFKKGTSYKEALHFFRENKKHGLWHQYERIIRDNGCIALWAQSPFSHMLAESSRLYRYEWVIEKTNASGHLNAKRMPMKCHEEILIFYKHLPKYHPQKTDGHPRKVSTAAHKKNCRKSTNYGDYNPASYDSTERYPRDVLTFPWDKQTSRLHPTQKPLDACRYMIKTYTDPGDLVLDSCMGSNTTGLACKELGREYIGMEKDMEIFKIAKKRTGE